MALWTDRAGRFSALKTIVLALLCLPAVWLLWRWAAQDLGSRPLNEAIRFAGTWTTRILLVALAVSSIRQIFRWSALINVRRMIGVASFCYVALHLTLYTVDLKFDLLKVATEIVLRIYLTIGAVAIIMLALMAATSTDGMMKRMGGKAWQKLHLLSYPAAVLALAHFFLQSKVDVTEPVLTAGLFLWLMIFRLWRARLVAMPGALSLVAMAIITGVLTALGEAGWYAAFTGVNALMVLGANLGVDLGIRPSWWVTGVCLAIAFAQVLHGLASRVYTARRAPA